MLVVPNHWGRAPISEDKQFQVQLRHWANEGVEMFVHGWFHKDNYQHGWLNDLKARHLTNREGEFLGLDEETAYKRIVDGRSLVEDIIGRPIAGFVAPAWLYGAPAKRALQNSGIRIAEDHFRIWDPLTGQTLSSSPVISWATRTWIRAQSSKAFAAVARHTLGPFSAVRLAVHPSDCTNPSVMASITRTIETLKTSRIPGHYGELGSPFLPVQRVGCLTENASQNEHA
jgi:predicted deacetylase